ncbi:RNA-DNA + DNA-DNA helicase [Morganella phage vB_Mm5]
MGFKNFLQEAVIDDFMSKVATCRTLDGLNELEKYYKKRIKETDVDETDDIAMRDAIAGKRSEFESADDEEPDKF